MAIRRFPRGEFADPEAGEERRHAERALQETVEELTMAAILRRVDAALNEAPDSHLGPLDHLSTGEEGHDGPRYEVREDDDGWQVADLLTGFVAEVDGFILARLSARRANSLADVLNRLDLKERGSNSSD
jgi:hypothetical protein